MGRRGRRKVPLSAYAGEFVSSVEPSVIYAAATTAANQVFRQAYHNHNQYRTN